MSELVEEIKNLIVQLMHDEEETIYALSFLYGNRFRIGFEDFSKGERQRIKGILDRLMQDSENHHRWLEVVYQRIAKQKESKP